MAREGREDRLIFTIRRPARSTLFPYTTLFRSLFALMSRNATTATAYFGIPPDRVVELGEQRSEEHTSELQSQSNLVCRLLLEKKKNTFAQMSNVAPGTCWRLFCICLLKLHETA